MKYERDVALIGKQYFDITENWENIQMEKNGLPLPTTDTVG